MKYKLPLLLAGLVGVCSALLPQSSHAGGGAFAVANHPLRGLEEVGLSGSGANWNTSVDRLQEIGCGTIRVEFAYKATNAADWSAYIQDRMDVYNRFQGAGLGGQPAAGVELLGLFTFYGGSQAYGGNGQRPTATEFRNFVKGVLGHFKDKITYWEIGNEPNGTQFWDPIGSNPNPVQADANEYVDNFLKVAWDVIKGPSGLDMDAKVIAAGIAGNLANSTNYVNWMLARGAKTNCDYIAWHDYNNPPDEDPADGGSDGFTRFQALYSIMNSYGIGTRGIWMTEYGGSVPMDASDHTGARKDVASKMQRYFMLCLALDKMTGFPPLNFQRMFYYEQITEDTSAVEHGMMINDSGWTRNPVYYAYSSMANKFGANPVSVKRISLASEPLVYCLVFSNSVTVENWMAIWSAEPFAVKPSVQFMNGSTVVQRFPKLDRSPQFLRLTSPVSSYSLAAYTVPGGLSNPTREAECVPIVRSSGKAFSIYDETGASNGQFTIYESTAVGDYVTFWVNVPVAGTYDIQVVARRKNDRAKVKLHTSTGFGNSATWTQVGGEKNMSNGSTTPDYGTLDFGNVALAEGNNAIRFTVSTVGPAGSRISVDSIKMYQQ